VAILSQALTRMAFYLPRVGMAALIIVLGFAIASLLREMTILACNSAQVAQGAMIAQAVYVTAILLVIVTAIDQLGIDTRLMTTLLVLLVGGLVAGAALSFGLGAREAVSNLIAAHYLRPVLTVGQRVTVSGIEGRVVRQTPTAVVLETAAGRMLFPAAKFLADGPVVRAEDDAHAR
jgi:hypothetical protein